MELKAPLVSPVNGPRKESWVQKTLVPVLCDLALVVVLLAVLPLLLFVLFLVMLPCFIEKWLHPRRDYLDGVSAVQAQQLEGAAIHGVFLFKERVSSDTVFKHFEQVYLSESSRPEFLRFKQRTFQRAYFWPYWEDLHAPLDMAYHFQRHDKPMNHTQFQDWMGDLQGDLLDFTKPAWQLHCCENLTDELGNECSAAVLKIHHCYHDGFTGLRVFMQCADPKAPPSDDVQKPRSGSRKPKTPFYAMVPLFLKSLKKLLLMPNDPASIFKATKSADPKCPRHTAFHCLEGVSVDDIKAFGKSEKGGGATVNDVLLAALGGAFRRHVKSPAACTSGSFVPEHITACMWVSKAPLAHAYKDFDEVPLVWGNSLLGCCYLRLPLHDLVQKEGEKVPATVTDMQARTGAPELMLEAGLATFLLAIFGWIPAVISKPLWDITSNKISCSTSNVPGPPWSMKWCGGPVRSIFFFVPPQGKISVFVTILTHAGKVSLGMACDASTVETAAVRAIVSEYFEAELKDILS